MTQKVDVLVVDDSAEARELLLEFLSHWGYGVHECASAATALESLRGGMRPTAIILDLIMPGMTGADFLREVSADQALMDIPVVLLTAYPEDAEDLRPNALLAKPVESWALLRTLERYCGPSRN